MQPKLPSDVVKLLRTRILPVKIGLWLIPNEYLGHEADEAVRLGIEALDISKFWLDNMPKGTKFIGLTPEKLLERMDDIAELPGGVDCVLIYNFDLMLAHLKQSGRKDVWEGLYLYMRKRTRALLIVMPETAVDLLPPPGDLIHWSQEDRLAGTM